MFLYRVFSKLHETSVGPTPETNAGMNCLTLEAICMPDELIRLKGIGGQAILPFLETPGTKVQIMTITYRLVTPVCRFGELIGSYT